MTWAEAKHARDRLAREQGTILKDWGGRIAIALIYPNSYYLGMSNLGLQTIYALLNRYDNVVCERVFWEGKAGRDGPLSLESQRPLADFALLAFSISYELDYFNVIQLLKSAAIPLRSGERDGRHPLLLAGGPPLTANPMPLSPVFDALAIGEGEVILPPLVEALSRALREKDGELRDAMAGVPGLYLPHRENARPVMRQWARDLDSFATTSVVLTPDTELGDMYLMEIERGCAQGCRFCLAGHLFRPQRHRSPESLLAQAQEGLCYRRRLGLVGPALSDHPQMEALTLALRRLGAQLSFSSLRPPVPPYLLRALAESGTRTITLAPEAGSERLRQVIHKRLSQDDVLKTVAEAARQGLRQIKLYFMVGLPTETEEDISELIGLARDCQRLLERGAGRLILNVSPFIPKAGTAFQWLPMAPPPVLRQRLSRIKRGLSPKGIELRGESMAWSLVQAALARGDARLGAALARMDRASLSAWRQAVREEGVELDRYWGPQPQDRPLPWSLIRSGIGENSLRREMEKAGAC